MPNSARLQECGAASSAACPKHNSAQACSMARIGCAGSEESKNPWSDDQWKAKGATISCSARK